MYEIKSMTFKDVEIYRHLDELSLATNFLFMKGTSLRSRIEKFEKVLECYDQVDIPVKHEFVDGLYKRQVDFPLGMLAVGKLHKTGHVDVMVTGEMLVATEDGFKHLKAPCVMTTKPGTRKAGIALKPTTWVTFHSTKCTTVEEVEAEIACDNYGDYEIDGECEVVNTSIANKYFGDLLCQ